jgi:hypothetical protein
MTGVVRGVCGGVNFAAQAAEEAAASAAAYEKYVAAPASTPAGDASATNAGEVMSQAQQDQPTRGAGHGTIRLRGREEVAVAEAPAAAPTQVLSALADLERAAKEAGAAAYAAYNPGHGRLPAANAGELLEKAAAARAALAAAQR